MTTINSISVSILVVLLAAGALIGLSASGTDLLNPNTSLAEAEAIRVEATHQQAVYKLQEQLAQAKTEADVQALQREQKMLNAQHEHDIQVLNQDLEHRDIAFKTWMLVVIITGSAFSVTLIIGTSLWVGSKAWTNVRTAKNKEDVPTPTPKSIPSIEKTIHPLPEREPYDPLETPQELYKRRLGERLQELSAQQQEIEIWIKRMEEVSSPARISKEEYKKRPLAG